MGRKTLTQKELGVFYYFSAKIQIILKGENNGK